MIPILYDENERAFTSNGLGRLADAVTCTVTEERNGSYELYMEYPVDGQHYADIAISRYIYAVPADGKAPQSFRVYRIEKPVNGIVSVYAEHVSYQLNFIPVMPFTAHGIANALQGLVENAAEECPFTVWTNRTTGNDYTVAVPQSFRALLGGTQGSILDVFGAGEYEFDMYTVKLWQHRGADNGVVIRYGKNLIDLKQDESIEETITGIAPYWQNAETGEPVTLPEKVMHSANAENFPFRRTRPLDMSDKWDMAPTEAQLRAAGQAYIDDNGIGVPKVSISIEFAALWQWLGAGADGGQAVERINLCDTVTVKFERLGVSATAKVIKTEYDVLKDRYNRLEIGDARTSLNKIITAAAQDVTDAAVSEQTGILERYVQHQTQLITGGLGGYKVDVLNADGKPQETLWMDTDDITTAVNIIRVNKNGIGFSRNGYSGPYFSAWTIDGIFNASCIGAGELNAALLKVGTIMDAAGKNWWNLETGDMHVSGAITTGELDTAISGVTSLANAAQDTAAAALTAAGSKSTAYYSTQDPPTTGTYSAGDIWVKSVPGGTGGDVMYIYTGSAWAQRTVGATTILKGSIVTDLLAAGAITISKLGTDVTNEINTAQTTADGAVTAASAAQNAASTADGKAAAAQNTASATQNTLGTLTLTHDDVTYINGGKIYAGSVTANQIAAGAITSGNISLYGKMGVYTDSTLTINGGYIGYMAGATANGVTTDGVAMMDGNNRNHIIATSAGVRMTNITDGGIYASLNISGGGLAYKSTSTGRVALQGNVYLNYNGSAFSGATYTGPNVHVQASSSYGEVNISAEGGGAVYVYDSNGAKMGTLYANTSGGYLTLVDSEGRSAQLTYADIVKLHNL